MSTMQTSACIRHDGTSKKRFSLLQYFRDSVAEVDAAHEARRQIETLPEGVERDAGMSREEILGQQTWQASLPFFMQPGAFR